MCILYKKQKVSIIVHPSVVARVTHRTTIVPNTHIVVVNSHDAKKKKKNGRSYKSNCSMFSIYLLLAL